MPVAYPPRLRSIRGVGTVWRQVAVKPYGFRLTKTQLAVRRDGPRLSNNYCVSAIMWLFSCDLRGISIGDLPTSLPIKRWISLPNHATYAHNSGIRRHIYGKSALSIPYSPINGLSFYTYANGEQAVAVHASCPSFVVSIDGLLLLHFCKWRMTGSRVCLMVFPHCLL